MPRSVRLALNQKRLCRNRSEFCGGALSVFYSALLYLGVFTAAQAQTVHKTFQFHGHPIAASASLTPGAQDKPAFIVLHGFLTHNQFPTVKTLHTTIADAGYTVLSPNLTYGYPNRKHALKCTSLHTHTLQDEMDELGQWVNWLLAQGYPGVVLVGHSSGSALTLAYLQHKHYPSSIKAVILTSLFYLTGPELGTRPQEVVLAQTKVAKGETAPLRWHHQFCHGNYLATPQAFLSYQKPYSKENILQALKETAQKIPAYIIMGGGDKRYEKTGRDLLKAYKAAGAHLYIIDGASHFFDQEHEFDLTDTLTDILDALGTVQS